MDGWKIFLLLIIITLLGTMTNFREGDHDKLGGYDGNNLGSLTEFSKFSNQP